MLCLAIACAAGLFFSVVCRRIAFRTNCLSHPNPIVAQHIQPVPYLGGVAVFAAAIVGLGALLALPPSSHVAVQTPAAWLWLGGFGFLLVGLIDDIKPFRPLPKFTVQVALTMSLLVFGKSTPWTGVAVIEIAVHALWIVTIVNAVNLTDVCDGLMTGLSCIALVAIAMAKPQFATWALLLAGGAAGVLAFNFPPARIFQGDAGSHLLGYTLGAMTLPDAGDSVAGAGWSTLALGPLLLGVFLFELVFITKMRRNKGLPWWKGSPDHFALRMQAAGFSKTRTILIAWSAAVAFALTALWLQRGTAGAWGWACTALLGAGCIGAWCWLRGLQPPVSATAPVSDPSRD